MADGTMSSKFMKSAFVGWTFTAGVYYPPDFDASKLMPVKALKESKGPQMMNIRMMFPFTMVCDSCKEYNYTGTKFTAKTEMVKGESYLGLKVYRFYGRCRHCWSEFTFKTDPKNSDYTMESGGKRTYEAWKDADAMEAELKREKEQEAAQDQMKALEQKAVDVQSEMQRLEDLDAIRTLNKRLGNRDQSIQSALDYLFQQDTQTKAAEEEEMSQAELNELKGFKEEKEQQQQKEQKEEGETKIEASSSSPGPGAAILTAVQERAAQAAEAAAKAKPKFTVKVKRKATEDAEGEAAAKKACSEADAASTAAPTDCGGGLLGAYESDSS